MVVEDWRSQFNGDVKDAETDPVAQMEQRRRPIIGAVSGFAIMAGLEISAALIY